MDLSVAYRHFRGKLETLRTANPPQEWNWYPYHSMENIPVLDRLLKTADFSIKELLESGPVLDVGCADGDLTFFLESIGAEVDAVDYPPTNYNGMRGIRALHVTLASSARVFEQNIDSHFEPPRERYGVCFALGLLYHLKNPFSFLETLAQHADYCFLSTRVAACFPNVKQNVNQSAVAYLLDADELNGDNTNYWIFSDAGLHRVLKRSGWEMRTWVHNAAMPNSDPVRADRDQRAFCFLQSERARLWRRVERRTGWHAFEEPGFRWTEKRFTLHAQTRGELRMKIFVPEVLLERGHPITLVGRSSNSALVPETFSMAGVHLYRRPVSAAGDLEFETSFAIPADERDPRERGLVVMSAEIW